MSRASDPASGTAATAPGAARLLAAADASLSARGIESALLDAEVLLAHCLGVSRNELIVEAAAGRDRAVSPDTAARFWALVERRRHREPVAYLTGHREFWSLDFEVTPDVLIPRPETEHVVERALAMLPPPGPRPVRVVDVGTGSGAIAIAIAVERPDVRVVALDRSEKALAVARGNAILHGVADRVRFLVSDLLEAVGGPVDSVVSNPPYILRAEADALMPDVRDWEPALALFDDVPGEGILGRLVDGAAKILAPGGCFVAEIADARGAAALALLEASGPWDDAAVTQDFAGLKRVLLARRGHSRS